MTHSQEKEMCMCNFIPPRGVHGEGCVNAKPEETTTSDWAEYIKTLPDNVRVGLAKYVAQLYLDGIEKGKKEFADELRESILKLTPLCGACDGAKCSHTLACNFTKSILALLPEQESK